MEHRSERRLITCVFVDVVGSTDLGQRLGPERMQRRLAEAFGHISGVAIAEGGTIEKYIGDAIFVLFGAPAAHGDDVVRALRTAEAAARWAETSESLSVRVGVETGEALVDLDGVGERQRMAVGTCVNVAARLQQQADPGQVIVGPICRAAAANHGDFEDAGTLRLKGLGDIHAWRFVRLTAGQPALPFVGRHAELDLLRAAYERASAGHATLVLVTGPPGIGKTSLVQEFSHSLAGEARVLEARFRPGTEVGSSPLRQLIADTDPDLIPPSVTFSAGVRSDARLLALLASERQNEIYVGWRDYLGELAREGPVLLCLEDLHWAESEVIRLVDRLTFAEDMRLLNLASARPEFPAMPLLRPTKGRLVLELPPLDREAARALARSAGGREVDVERAEGHPLFIVELVRARDSDGPVPVTVQAAIGARLDELPEPERELLQMAGVIGETFDVRGASLLAQRDPAEVAGVFGRLAHLRYIHPVDGGFRFNHALVRDIAYGRLPVATRLRLHAQYAAEGLGLEEVEAMAHHWWEALGPSDAAWVWEGNRDLDQMRAAAVRALVAAGAGLADRFAFERATEVFEHALQLARDPKESAQVEEAFGLACARNALGEDANQHRMKAIGLYRDAGLEAPVGLYADMLDLTVFNWGYFKHPPSFDQVIGLIDEGIAAARRQDDSVNLVRLLGQRGLYTKDATVLPETSRLLERAADLRPHANALWRLALVHFLVSRDLERALYLLDLAFSLGEVGAAFNEPEALMWRSDAYFHAGNLERADADADRLLEIGRSMSPHTRQHALGTKARVLAARGDWPGVLAQAGALRALVRDSPDASFCLVGANLAGYAAIAELMTGQPLSNDVDAFAQRLVPDAPATRAAVLLVPFVMAARPVSEEDARRAYAPETPIWDNQAVWDLNESHFAVANTMRGRWSDVEGLLPQLDAMAEHGATLASALAAALREERDAARGGPRPQHEALRKLGYNGVSELLSYRVP